MLDQLKSAVCPFLTPDWLTAFGTVAAVAVALIIAVTGERIARIWFHPRLNLEANVRRPDAEMARRGQRISETEMRDIGFAYFFRLAITNTGNAAARDVQVVLARIERRTGGRWVDVDRFTPMNLKWSYVGTTTREVTLPGIPAIFCDFIHVGDPATRAQVLEDLQGVAPGDVVLALDVEAIPLNQGNLLEPGTYRFHLILVAGNYDAEPHTVEVSCAGRWFPQQAEMFDKGFRMTKI